MAPKSARPHSRTGQLTPRQREILALLAQGLYYREIGAQLGISLATVRAHLHATYQKLQVKSRARAAIVFHERGGLAGRKKEPALLNAQ